MAKLDEDVKLKVKSFLTSKGKNIKNLTENQINDLYWEVLSEAITSSEDNPIDIKKAKEIAKKEKDVVNTYVDGEPVQVTDEGVVLGTEEIEVVVKDNQNPVMSKSEMIQEMRNQIISEANKYEDEYNSDENEYSKHLDPDAVRDMGRRLYNDIRQAAQQKLGGADINRVTNEMSGALMNILNYEMDKKPQLQEEAIRLIRDKYPAMTEDVVDIEAIITGHPQMGGRLVDSGDMRYEKGNTPPPEGYNEDELKSEITKRRLINAMSQGSARKTQNLHHLADDSRIPSEMKSQYGKLMAANDFIYWALDRETIRQQGREGVHAGNSKVKLDPETRKPKVIAQGMTFSILLHELDKGIKELIALHGTHEDMELNKYVQDQVDHLDAEQDDIRLGVGIWEKVSQFIDIENPQHEALLFHKLVSLPSSEMNSLINGLVSDNENSVNKLREMAEDVSNQLRQEEYDDAMGEYDEPSEQQPIEDDGFPDPEKEDDGEYSDPLLRDLMGGSNKQEPSGEPDYSRMSKRDLQDLMDDALDAGDFQLAGKIGPYLN